MPPRRQPLYEPVPTSISTLSVAQGESAMAEEVIPLQPGSRRALVHPKYVSSSPQTMPSSAANAEDSTADDGDTAVLFHRSEGDKARQPIALNLSDRELHEVPLLMNEAHLALLSLERNSLCRLQHLRYVPNLIFLDLHANRLEV